MTRVSAAKRRTRGPARTRATRREATRAYGSSVRTEAEALERTESAAREDTAELGALFVVEGLVNLAKGLLRAFTEPRELGVVALERGVERVAVERGSSDRGACRFTRLSNLAAKGMGFVEELGEGGADGLLLSRAGVEVGEEAIEHGERAAAPSTAVAPRTTAMTAMTVVTVVTVVAAATDEAGVASAAEHGDEADQGRDADHESEHGEPPDVDPLWGAFVKVGGVRR